MNSERKWKLSTRWGLLAAAATALFWFNQGAVPVVTGGWISQGVWLDMHNISRWLDVPAALAWVTALIFVGLVDQQPEAGSSWLEWPFLTGLLAVPALAWLVSCFGGDQFLVAAWGLLLAPLAGMLFCAGALLFSRIRWVSRGLSLFAIGIGLGAGLNMGLLGFGLWLGLMTACLSLAGALFGVVVGALIAFLICTVGGYIVG